MPPHKKINENTKKMKIARNCENSHLPRSFRKWEWGMVLSRRPLSGTTALVGNESRFCRSKRPQNQSFTEEFSDMGWDGLGCQPSLLGKVCQCLPKSISPLMPMVFTSVKVTRLNVQKLQMKLALLALSFGMTSTCFNPSPGRSSN